MFMSRRAVTQRDIEEEFKRWTFKQPKWSMRLHHDPYDRYGAPRIEILHETEDSRGIVAQGKHDVLTITFSELIPPYLLEDIRFFREGFGDWLRTVIHGAVTHEADEWLKRDGEIVFDPHRKDRFDG